MKPISIPNRTATFYLGLVFLVANVAGALYAARGLEPSPAFVLLYYAGFGGLISYWVHADSQRLGVREVMDQGWFLFALWPIALPYHLFKTRGAKGGLTLLGLVGLFAVTYLFSLLLFLAVRRGGGPD